MTRLEENILFLAERMKDKKEFEVDGIDALFSFNEYGLVHRRDTNCAIYKCAKDEPRLMKNKLTLAPWMPKIGQRYYFPVFHTYEGCEYNIFENDKSDNRIINAVGAYKSPEEALQKAKELGWL